MRLRQCIPKLLDLFVLLTKSEIQLRRLSLFDLSGTRQLPYKSVDSGALIGPF
jgi:hypothetical protein